MLSILCQSLLNAHSFSISIDCTGKKFHLSCHRKTVKPKYFIKVLNIPEKDLNHFGDHELWDHEHQRQYAKDIAKVQIEEFEGYFEGDMPFGYFMKILNTVNDLAHDIEHRNLKTQSSVFKRKAFETEDQEPASVLEGRTVRSIIVDKSIFESNNILKMIVGFPVTMNPEGLHNFITTNDVSQITLDQDYLVRAGVLSSKTGKPIEIIMLGNNRTTAQDIQQKIDQILGDGEKYKKAVQAELPNQKYTGMMGGITIAAGYHYPIKKFTVNARTGLDCTFGKFKQTYIPEEKEQEMLKMDIGYFFGLGLDYPLNDKATIGFELGLEQKRIKQEKDSIWITAPYIQIVCNNKITEKYSLGVFTGYTFTRKFTIKNHYPLQHEDAECKFSGMFGGIRLSRYL